MFLNRLCLLLVILGGKGSEKLFLHCYFAPAYSILLNLFLFSHLHWFYGTSILWKSMYSFMALQYYGRVCIRILCHVVRKRGKNIW